MVKFKGETAKLAGSPLKVGDKMPQFSLVGNSLETVTFADTSGVRLFLAVPSLDTAVCDLEVRTFNQKLGQLGDVSVYTVSMDLPFAQKRWCAAAGIEAVKTLSDFKLRSFGEATGTLMTDIGLLARAVFVVNADGEITYLEYVPDVGSHPDYEAAYAAVLEAH